MGREVNTWGGGRGREGESEDGGGVRGKEGGGGDKLGKQGRRGGEGGISSDEDEGMMTLSVCSGTVLG